MTLTQSELGDDLKPPCKCEMVWAFGLASAMANGLIRLRDNLDPIIGKQRRRERKSATPPRLFSPQKHRVGRALSEEDEDGNRGPSINDVRVMVGIFLPPNRI